jgi:hypothetical protein
MQSCVEFSIVCPRCAEELGREEKMVQNGGANFLPLVMSQKIPIHEFIYVTKFSSRRIAKVRI